MKLEEKSGVKGPLIPLELSGHTLYLLGTAHVSKESVEDVGNLIKYVKPDIISIELCQSRYNKLIDPNKWSNLDIITVIKQKKVYLLLSSIILGAFQKKMADEMGIKPGAEMQYAIEEAQKQSIKLKLIDRDIQITLRRAWQTVGFFGKMILLAELITSFFYSNQLEIKDIEEMKQKDVLENLLTNIPFQMKKVKYALVDERDQYMAGKVQTIIQKLKKPKQKIIAVVGAGHLKGIEEILKNSNTPSSLEKLEYVKPKSTLYALLKFTFSISIISFLFWYFSDGLTDKNIILQNVKIWIIIKSMCSAFFALILRGHIFSILGAALTGPISNFNPILKPGWVAALSEAYFNKPKVEDFEKMMDDVSSFKGFFSNKVLRILLMFILPQLGSSLGTFFAFWYIVSM